MEKKYFTEKKLLKPNILRPLREGTEEMLNAYPERKVYTSLRNVDVVYGSGLRKNRAINDLNLNIYEGEVLGLVGESGSGKSTTGRALVGLTPYSFGEIKIGDITVPREFKKGFKFGDKLKEYKRTIKYMANNVQMIFQDPANSLNPNKNILKVISEGLDNLKNSRNIYLTNLDKNFVSELEKIVSEQELEKVFSNNLKDLNLTLEQDYTQNESILYDKIKNSNLLLNLKFQTLFDETIKQREAAQKMSDTEIKKALIISTLKQVGLDESVLTRYPLEFSGGQQQRVGIARSVVLRPKLLVADEPISALDVSIQAQVVNIFNDLKDKYNLTILFIAHDLRMVEYISDRIAVIYKGVLLEVGPTHEIINNPFHPYTKSLLDAVPSIESKKGSLIGFVYNPNIHKYTETYQPKWIELNNKHFVLATDEEFSKWSKGDYTEHEVNEEKGK